MAAALRPRGSRRLRISLCSTESSKSSSRRSSRTYARQKDRLMHPENIEDIYPLSPLQQGLLFHTLENPGSGAYVEQLSCALLGPLDLAAFGAAWQSVIDRHPVLRTAFVW